jgi:hypothetical protein
MRKITLFLTTLLLVTKAMATVDIADTYYTTVTTETSGEFALYDVTGKTFVKDGDWNSAATSDEPYYWTVAYNSEKTAYTLARTDGKYLKIGNSGEQYLYCDGEGASITYWTFDIKNTKTYTVYSKNGHHADSDGSTDLKADYYLIGANAGTESSSAHEYALISKADYANYQMSLDAFAQKASALSAGAFALYDVTQQKFVREISSSNDWESNAIYSDEPSFMEIADLGENKYSIKNARGFMKIDELYPSNIWMNGTTETDYQWEFTENTSSPKTYILKQTKGYYMNGTVPSTKDDASGAHVFALIAPLDYAKKVHAEKLSNDLYPAKYAETSAITPGTYALYDIEAGKFLACNTDPYYQYFEYSNVPVYCTIAKEDENYTIKYGDKFMTQYPTASGNINCDARIKWLTSGEIASDENVTDKSNDYKWAFISTNDVFANSYMLADITNNDATTRLYYGVNPLGTDQRLTLIGSGGVHHVVFVKQTEFDAAAKGDDATITVANYATFYNASTTGTYLLPLAYKAIYLKLVDGELKEEQITSIPPQTAVILSYSNDNIKGAARTETFYKSMESADAIVDNQLKGTENEETITPTEPNMYYYTLQNGSQGVGLYYADATADTPGNGQTAFTNGAKKAYLKLEKNAGGANIKSYIFGEGAEYEDFGATAIESVGAAKVADDAIYNLAGQKVGADYKGIVIKNGKKYIVK